MASKIKFSSLSDPDCLKYVKRQERIVENLQLAWSITNDIIGYSMIAAIIWYGVSHGYWGSKAFNETYFCTKLKMCWYELLYIYLKNWSFAAMAFIAFDVFMRDCFLPFVEASSGGATVTY